MILSDRGALALIRHEGIVPGPYLDSANPPVWTYGRPYGMRTAYVHIASERGSF